MSGGQFVRCDECRKVEYIAYPKYWIRLSIERCDLPSIVGKDYDFCSWGCVAIWSVRRRGPLSLRAEEVRAAMDGAT